MPEALDIYLPALNEVFVSPSDDDALTVQTRGTVWVGFSINIPVKKTIPIKV